MPLWLLPDAVEHVLVVKHSRLINELGRQPGEDVRWKTGALGLGGTEQRYYQQRGGP